MKTESFFDDAPMSDIDVFIASKAIDAKFGADSAEASAFVEAIDRADWGAARDVAANLSQEGE
jgi:hypothetical protein